MCWYIKCPQLIIWRWNTKYSGLTGKKAQLFFHFQGFVISGILKMDHLNQPHSMGTTIIGVTYNGGVVLGADSRTSTGSTSTLYCTFSCLVPRKWGKPNKIFTGSFSATKQRFDSACLDRALLLSWPLIEFENPILFWRRLFLKLVLIV